MIFNLPNSNWSPYTNLNLIMDNKGFQKLLPILQKLLYFDIIGQNFVGQNFWRTKFSTPSWNFDTFAWFLPDFCIETLDKILDRQNFSSDKIFDTKPKFRQCCPIFAGLLYWNIGQNFRRTKVFVGQNFRHQAEISTLLSDEFLSDKVTVDPIGVILKLWVSDL